MKKSSEFGIKPGDFIKWMYVSNNKFVVEDEELWSMIEDCWVPIGSKLIHLCINVDINNDVVTWLNEKGCFRAQMISQSNNYNGVFKPWTRRHGRSAIPCVF